MIDVFTTSELIPQLQEWIAAEDQLDELVSVYDLLEKKPAFSAMQLIVRPKKGIMHAIDWMNTLPPYILPEEIDLSRETFMGLIFAKLGNYPRAEQWLSKEAGLLHELSMIAGLQAGVALDSSDLQCDFRPFEEYRLYHNTAILHHYAATEASFDPEKTRYFYEEALNAAPNGEYAAFSSKHLAAFLSDMGQQEEAAKVLEQALPAALSDEAGFELKSGLTQIWLKQLTVPYDPVLLERLKHTLWEVLEYFEQNGRQMEAALTLSDAAQIAQYSNSFAEGLGYINRALDIFRREETPELLAQAHYRRAMLLYTWAKNGNPQFFRAALDSFKEAVKVFNREDAPQVFADIQQYLGIIYAEMPDEDLKPSVWAAISASSFQEALAFYRKDRFPYEYAMICNHYGNALTKFPPAVHSDNIEKALFYYQEALSLRTAQHWPLERAVTLLNYVEACWLMNRDGKEAGDQQLLEEMKAKALEAKALTEDPNIREAAEIQLQHLESLKQVLS